jgi:hypothetical protein
VYTLPCEWNRQVHVRGWVEVERVRPIPTLTLTLTLTLIQAHP